MPKYTENNPNDQLWKAYYKIKPYRSLGVEKELWKAYYQLRQYAERERLYHVAN